MKRFLAFLTILCLGLCLHAQVSQQANEYSYDENGNLTKDLNRNISEIQYNCLNLPSQVVFGSAGVNMQLFYRSDGKLLRKVYVGINRPAEYYCGNVVYENSTAKRLLTEEGYVDLTDNSYHYFVRDHQGNNRVVVNGSGMVEEVNHYYPFGGLFATASSVQPYKYNGKELLTQQGLNWYDYGARHYDATLGRWSTIDPMAEKYYSVSPYAYCGKNPIIFSDPDGKRIVIGSLLGRILAYFGADNYESKVQKDLDRLKKENSDVNDMIRRLEDSKYEVEIRMTNPLKRNGKNYISPKFPQNVSLKQGSTIHYNPEDLITTRGEKRSPRIGLTHELGHADDLIQGKAIQFNPNKAKEGDKLEQSKGIENERHPIEMENKIREIDNLPLRKAEDYYK